jgi:PAS domain S-box-containing protein
LLLLGTLVVVSLLMFRLRRSESQFRLLAENMSDLICLHSPEGKHLWLSPSVERILGYTPKEMVGRNTREFIHPEDAPLVEAPEPGCPATSSTHRARRKDGTYVWLETLTTPILDKRGRIAYFQTAARDVTERKRAEALYRFLIRNLPNTSVFLFDHHYRHLVADGVLGGNTIPLAGEMEGRTLREVFGHEMASVLRPFYNKVFLGVPEVTEQSFRTRTYQIHFLPVRDGATGGVELGMAVFVDVTEQKRIIQALQDQTLDLERSNRDLERFANVASHELKSPLRRIASFAELLAEDFEGLLNDEADEYINHIIDGVRSLSEVIESLLVYSRVQTDATHMEWVNLNDVCDEVCVSLAPLISDAGAEVQKGGLPTVTGDRVLLKQLLQNLLTNAVKFYCGDSHPIVHITADRDLLDWEVSVADNGPGIPPDQHGRIFEMFQRLRPNVVGSGIGLALCKKIVSIHRGKIWVESSKLGGSDFHFRLPAKSPEEATASGSLPPGRYNPFDLEPPTHETLGPPPHRKPSKGQVS